jgi:DNA-binding transcriptional ArsR family regulator
MASAARRLRPRTRHEPERLARFYSGLADPTRVEILTFLLDGPKTAGEIVAHVGRHQASVSSHLTCLRFCGFVEARRDGRSVIYELIDHRVRQLMLQAERMLEENAERIMACRVIAPGAPQP